jgi:pyruvate formate lyase activating enzyme
MYPASFYRPVVGQQIQCMLCPHGCLLLPGQSGFCKTRMNRAGRLFTQSYGILSTVSTDPIEKKPLYHFLPGRSILSIGSFGCNMACDFCQNCTISQVEPEEFHLHPVREPVDIVNKALLHAGNIGLAYTYNEPVVYYEYMVECATLLKQHGMMNVMVTNGFINREPLEGLLPLIDAFNIDLKSFREQFYHSRSSAHLKPVLDTITRVANSDCHLELTFLIIPGHNDSPKEWTEMIRWIDENCGEETILHVSKYFPRNRLKSLPTPTETMERFLQAAREKLLYVYPGNNPMLDSSTRCPSCGNVLIEREIYHSRISGLDQDGCCSRCHFRIKGIFKTKRL